MRIKAKKLISLSLLITLSILFLPKSTLAYGEAYDFIYPLDDWFENLVDYFGSQRGPNLYHLGDDCAQPAGTPVYATADGYARHIGIHTRFGTVVIIEHTLPKGEKVCSLYGHLRNDTPVAEGQFINKGQIIGYLGTIEENGGWGPHLHFGIRKGGYVNVNHTWVYWGMNGLSELKYWYSPTEFVAGHQGKGAEQIAQARIITGAGSPGRAHIRMFKASGKETPGKIFAFEENFFGGVDVATGDIDGDEIDEIIVGAGPGGKPYVKIYGKNSQRLISSFLAFDSKFKGGVRVTAGDIDKDGMDEIIVGAGTGGGPQVRVFEADGTPRGIQFFAFHPDSRTGVDVAAGDVDGDGKAEIAVTQLANGEAWVKVYRYNNKKTILGEWRVFGTVECGAKIAMGDIDKDEKQEIIVGAGKGGGPQVRVFEKDGTPRGIQFFAFHPDFRGGVDVSSFDYDLDGKDEIIVSQANQGQAWTKVYRYNSNKTILANFLAYLESFEGGTNVAGID